LNSIRLSLAIVVLVAGDSYAQESTEEIRVIGRTPLGAGLDAGRIASNVQSATGKELRDQRALELADFMKRNLAGVFINEAQNNPLQPDVQYRGFVGSSLLGLPQGLAVYQNGVRINEPFGDTVNWALIPESAIDTVYLMPGSNPLFGLNALGGAIAIETKNGFSSAETEVEVYAGSFGRRAVQGETGGSMDDRFAYFVTGAYLEEDGWRNFSPTEASQAFGNVRWQADETSIDLNVTLADTNLIGNGSAPIELLEIDREAIFTRPDQTENELMLVNLAVERDVSSSLTLTGNVYLRGSDIDTFNGDDSDFVECENDPGFVCEEESDGEHLIFGQTGLPVPSGEDVEGATVNRTNIEQDSRGVGLQATWTGDLGGRENFFLAGLGYDDNDIDFGASTELGALDSTRLAIPSGFFIGDLFTRLRAETSTIGIYLSNTFTLSEGIALTVSGRYNHTEVKLRDRLGTELDGDHTFERFNPAVGMTVILGDGLSLYASYSESSRAPSPVELTCADEEDPCRLPNAFLADPPLDQVVAETVEAGLRGDRRWGRWHAGVFSTTNENDILFISAGALTNQGFFDNVGRTRREGVEVNVDGEVSTVAWFANYTYLDATFRGSLTFPSANNPAAIGGEVVVAPGDRLPLVPRRLFKAGGRVALGDRFTVGGEILLGSDMHLRGDEGNDFARFGDYAVLNLRGDYRIADDIDLFLNVDNVFDEEYETFGLFGEAEQVLGEGFEDNRFLSPAAPRAAWIGVRIRF
jgi:iron complex outermembrane receptor protein